MFPVKIVGRRLTLRELTIADSAVLLALVSHPRVFERVGDESLPTIELMESVRQARLEAAQQEDRVFYELAIELDGTLIGQCVLSDINVHSGRAEIGYSVHPDHWGKGYAAEAARLLIEFGFTELGLHRIWATTAPGNAASQRVLQKTGMTFEGRLRGNKLTRGQRRDDLLFAVLATDPEPQV